MTERATLEERTSALEREHATIVQRLSGIEQAQAQTSEVLKAIALKLDSQSERGRLSPFQVAGLLFALVGAIGAPAVFTIRNLYQGEATASALAAHLEFSASKSEELTAADGAARERIRALESATVEGETQHKWQADVINAVHDYEDRMARAYCATCDRDGRASRIVYPERSYHPLQHVGEAQR